MEDAHTVEISVNGDPTHNFFGGTLYKLYIVHFIHYALYIPYIVGHYTIYTLIVCSLVM